MSKKDQPLDDSTLFQAAMQDVKRYKHTKIVPASKKTSTPQKKDFQPQDEQDNILEFSDFESLAPLGSEDIIFYAHPSLSSKNLRKLRSGQYNVEAILDLHGMRVPEARAALKSFIIDCRKKGVAHGLIIHGKGRAQYNPILKNKLNHWLRQTSFVLAFCTASHKDGRAGALYVWLRKK